MKVPNATSRDYLVQRIRDLARGGNMQSYKWNAGGMWKDREWNPEFAPTDAQVRKTLINFDY